MLLEYLNRGGALTWVILLALFIFIAICLERILYFLSTYIPFPNLQAMPKTDYKQIKKPVEQIFSTINPEITGLWQVFLLFSKFRLQQNSYYRIALVYQQHLHSSVKKRTAALKRNADEIIAQMERWIGGLQIIATVSPLLGLLGTILGMMESFQAIEDSAGQASMDQLAGGIWVAMLTTAFGLTVSIPAHLMYRFFHNLVNTRIRRMNAIVQYLEENYQ